MPILDACQDAIYHHDIVETGVYIIMMTTCDEDAPLVVLNGQLDSMDPCTLTYHSYYSTTIPIIIMTICPCMCV